MPISLICGSCNAKLAAPDSAVGKRVKCRQCGEILVVPAAEPEWEQADDAPPGPNSNPNELVSHDDHTPRPKKNRVSEVARRRHADDDEDDAPQYRKKQARSGAMIPLLVGGGVLGAALIAALVYFLGQKKPDGDTAKIDETPNPKGGQQQKEDKQSKAPARNALPAGWKQYDYPEFSAWYFDTNKNPVVTYSDKSGPFGDPVAGERVVWNESKNTPTRMLFIYAVPLTPENHARAANQTAEVLISILHSKHRCDGLKASDLKPTMLDGKPAFEVVEKQPRFTAFWTGAIANNRAYLLAVSGARLTESDTAVTTFRKSFRLSANAPAVPSAGGRWRHRRTEAGAEACYSEAEAEAEAATRSCQHARGLGRYGSDTTRYSDSNPVAKGGGGEGGQVG